MDDDSPFYWMDLEGINYDDIEKSIDNDELIGIVSEKDGGIIAYALGLDHANQIVEALTNAAKS